MAETISPQELQSRYVAQPDLTLIDVRTPLEYREVHVAFARNIPLDKLDPAQFQAFKSSDRTLYVCCHTGTRGNQACQKLRAAGVNVANIEGGTKACISAGLPLVRGKKAISLERQVRIAAGSIVLLGAGLAWWVDPAWIFLSAFIGAGLVFAGITDTCGMAMILARMPWNQLPECSANAASQPVGTTS
jgi:rhodanese-related sulfurtransferase